MGSTPESAAGSSADMVPLELEEFEDISLLMDKPPQSMRTTLWGKLKPLFHLGIFRNRDKGFRRLETDEFKAKDSGIKGEYLYYLLISLSGHQIINEYQVSSSCISAVLLHLCSDPWVGK